MIEMEETHFISGVTREHTFYRKGECNMCGQCCGADGNDNPWSPNTELRASQETYELFDKRWGMSDLFGATRAPDGGVNIEKEGETEVDGKKYPWVWRSGVPCKIENNECPLLAMADDGTRPCALWGTELHHKWEDNCSPGGELPPMISSRQRVKLWFDTHDKCSFVYDNENGERIENGSSS